MLATGEGIPFAWQQTKAEKPLVMGLLRFFSSLCAVMKRSSLLRHSRSGTEFVVHLLEKGARDPGQAPPLASKKALALWLPRDPPKG